MNNSFLPTMAIAVVTACYSSVMGLLIGLSEPQNYNVDESAVACIGILGMFVVSGLWFALYVEQHVPDVTDADVAGHETNENLEQS